MENRNTPPSIVTGCNQTDKTVSASSIKPLGNHTIHTDSIANGRQPSQPSIFYSSHNTNRQSSSTSSDPSTLSTYPHRLSYQVSMQQEDYPLTSSAAVPANHNAHQSYSNLYRQTTTPLQAQSIPLSHPNHDETSPMYRNSTGPSSSLNTYPYQRHSDMQINEVNRIQQLSHVPRANSCQSPYLTRDYQLASDPYCAVMMNYPAHTGIYSQTPITTSIAYTGHHRSLPKHQVTPYSSSYAPASVATRMRFPLLLYTILMDAESKQFADAISWLPHGRAFMIYDTVRFEAFVLLQYCRSQKWKSFRRQLNLYSFVRICRGRDRGGYYHRSLLRGRPDLLDDIKRSKVKGESTDEDIKVPFDEPDFYSMDPISPPPSVPSRTSISESNVTIERNAVVSDKRPSIVARKGGSST